jgi:hypothetical protein
MKAQGILYLLLLAFVLGGCYPTQQLPSTLPGVVPTTAMNTPMPLDLPTQGDTIQMTPFPSGLQTMVDISKEDLAKRLSIQVTEIKVSTVSEVLWQDSSLGCPQEGMAYTQVLTPGYLILLEYNNRKYEYHANKGNFVTYCMNPSPLDLDLPTQ